MDRLYEADWTGPRGDTRIANDIVIILSQKPFTFNAKGFMILDLNMFSAVYFSIKLRSKL